ncbi:hypothetical protein Ocin01_01984 [Orchesella cincta]|uniref:Transmembrane protein n=1 Tax=Orchesella cincta TaxID=48709 RepID=A0A1D2NHH0_ORCCI|nr:hypothetical protein Ocin01_01984 [Orchesella cincta]
MRRPPKPKPKPSITKAPKGFDKFQLTDQQKIQVKIIDWKRSAYVVLAHILGFLIIIGQSHFLIHESIWLIISFYGFIFNLILYFFGCGAALKALSYVWIPMKFRLGILAVVVALLVNIFLFFVGMHSSDDFESGVPKNIISFCNDRSQQSSGNYTYNEACSYMETVKFFIYLMPIILPPLALLCVCWALFATCNAVYVVPRRSGKQKVDHVWLEPYETYDFYVGRNIPRIPGYDEAFEDAGTQLKKYGLGVDDMDDDAGSDGPIGPTPHEIEVDEDHTSQSSHHSSQKHKGKKISVPLKSNKHSRSAPGHSIH